MVIRKFIIALVVKYDPKGFRSAEKDLGDVKKQVKATTTELKKLDKEQRATAASAKKLANSERDATKAERKAAAATRSLERAKKKLERTEKDLARAQEKSAQGRSEFLGHLRAVGPLAGGALAALTAMVAGLGLVGAGVIMVGSDFESLRAQLNNLLGSEAAGEAAFGGIKDFAKKTPFQIKEITTSFIRLQNQGIKPTEDRLTALGDIAAANGKELIDVTEAVLDAAVGENERLKEFGIKAAAAGDKVKFSFRGQTIEVDKNRDAITAALIQIGKMDGVAGSMAAQMATTKGVVSNLTDGFMTFIDQVAQLGVLEEFKGLLGDIAGAGGPGLAGVLASGLVSALKSVRSAIASITKEQIRSFLEGVADTMKTLGKVVELAAAALQVFIEMSGSASDAIDNMALAVLGLAAAFQGPAGLAVAAGAAGVVLGKMLANLITDLDGTNDRIATLDSRIGKLRATIAATEARIIASENRTAKASQEINETRAKFAKQGAAKVKKVVGGAGAGLRRELSPEDAAFRAQQVLAGTSEQQAQGRGELLTSEGQTVVAAVDAAQRKRVGDAESAARAEAKRGGLTSAQIAQSGKSARTAAEASVAADREKALTKATAEFGRTGSAKAAAAAGVSVISGKKKKGKKGKKDPFDFAAKAGKAAQSQAQEFAEREVERLVSSGVESGQAIKQAAAAGREKQAELTATFLKAGKIFATDTNNILDILGLNAPGSMLEGRAPPTSLIISPNIEINMIREFNQTNTLSGGAKQLEEVTGAAGKAAVTAGVEGFRPIVQEMIDSTINLNMNRLIKMAAGGRQPSGPQG